MENPASKIPLFPHNVNHNNTDYSIHSNQISRANLHNHLPTRALFFKTKLPLQGIAFQF